MSLGKLLVERLKSPGDETNVTAGAGAERATVLFADRDRYSVALQSLSVGGAATVGADVREFLSTKAAAIVQQLAYLEEPLAVWELDNSERLAQLRSTPPQREGDALFYWEVVLHAGEQPAATLARYHWTPGMAERESVVYPATFALIARLADSLAAALK